MPSHSPTLPPTSNSPDDTAPKPPGHLFRLVKRLSCTTNPNSAVYLCLPRSLEPRTDYESDDEFQPRVAKEHGAFKKLRDARMHQQTWLLEYPRVADAVVHMIDYNGVSGLGQKGRALLPRLVVVKTAVEPEAIRNEDQVIEFLHRGREYSMLHVGSRVVRSQMTGEPGSSWLCLRPVFGPTLARFGEESRAAGRGGIPGWLVAHIFLGLIHAVEFLHRDGVVHNGMDVSNVMLNLYPSYMHHRYRGYPDVQIIDFSHSTSLAGADPENDARGLLRVVQQVITNWSDVAPFLSAKAAGEGCDDALVLLSRDLHAVLGDDGTFGLEDVKQQFIIRAEDMRNTGPKTIPRDVVKMLHSDLATEEELGFAMRNPTVIKFGTKREELRRIVEGVPVEMGSGGHAGRKGGRILVMRFTARKAGFLRIVGEDEVEEVEDVEMKDFEKDDVEMVDEVKGEPSNLPYRSLFGGV